MNSDFKAIVDCIYASKSASFEQLQWILQYEGDCQYLYEKAQEALQHCRGKEVYLRALIEISNICKRNCYYCGLRKDRLLERYRLSEDEIMECCFSAYHLGIRTFVFQSGEEDGLSDDFIVFIVQKIKKMYPDCAITLSLGEKSLESYVRFKEAGVDRYLLRHETISKEHYELLHPSSSNYEERHVCLNNLKKCGYQVGCGIMVGSPYQTINNIVSDLLFIHAFQPQMVGIGPFIPCENTPFSAFKSGSLSMTLKVLALVRLMNPRVLLPSTTALATLHPDGTRLGLLAGANVIMPNFSPMSVRRKYNLYDNKKITDTEAGENICKLYELIESIGYKVKEDCGDY